MNQSQELLSIFDPERQQNWLEAWMSFDVSRLESLLCSEGEAFWNEIGWQRALALFQKTALRVPAYKDFLKKSGIDPHTIKTQNDFRKVPIMDKENYISRYSLEDCCWDGTFDQVDITAVSSGTTGEPSYWPRSGYQEFEAAVVHELLYRAFFKIQDHSTLLIIGFPMGVYVSGVATLLPTWLSTQKGYRMTVVSVGNNKMEVLKALKHLGPHYEQVLLIGHPFFVKDVLETGVREGMRWTEYHLGLLFCSEGFTESWRDYLVAITHGAVERHRILNLYGSSELLLMAYETPFTLSARKEFQSAPLERREVIAPSIVAQLFQYIPLFRFIESVKDELLFTASSGIPLIRFNLHDSGRVFFSDDVRQKFSLVPEPTWKLPTISMWGRSDYTIIFYAANLYPEHIKPVLYESQFVSYFTGNFTMQKGYLENQDEYLEIHVEMNPEHEPTAAVAAILQRAIVLHLKQVNMEYLFLCNHLDKDMTPRIILWPYRHETYFKIGVKPKFIVRV